MRASLLCIALLSTWLTSSFITSAETNLAAQLLAPGPFVVESLRIE